MIEVSKFVIVLIVKIADKRRWMIGNTCVYQGKSTAMLQQVLAC
jgi:hypothetical protein